MAFQAGIIHWRFADPPKVPARNHTEAPCFCAQFLPVGLAAELSALGIDNTRFIDSSLHSPNAFP